MSTTVHKARYVDTASRAFTVRRERRVQEAQERAEAAFAGDMRLAAHRIAGDVLDAYARDFNGANRSGALIVMSIHSWALLHTCLGSPTMELNPARATELLQIIHSLNIELNALVARAYSAGGKL